MERFSTDIHELRAKAREEVSTFHIETEDKIIVFFSEFPTISGFPYAIVLIENEKGEICSKFRQWDTQYDMKRWKNGIYNLDRLRIVTEEHDFSVPDAEKLINILAEIKAKVLPKNLDSKKAIVLDGSDWELKINTLKIKACYKWKVATEYIAIFLPLIEMIIHLSGINSKKI